MRVQKFSFWPLTSPPPYMTLHLHTQSKGGVGETTLAPHFPPRPADHGSSTTPITHAWDTCAPGVIRKGHKFAPASGGDRCRRLHPVQSIRLRLGRGLRRCIALTRTRIRKKTRREVRNETDNRQDGRAKAGEIPPRTGMTLPSHDTVG